MDEARILAHREPLLALAAESIHHGLRHGRSPRIDLSAHPDELHAPGACFVTLKMRAELRGCIGTAIASRPLIEDVAANAFAAAFRDPRFPPLDDAEFAEVGLSVSVLTAPAPMGLVDETDLLARLRPRIDGLIIESGSRRALFLPSVWEQLADPGLFLAYLKRKAGIDADDGDGLTAWCFQAVELTVERSAELRLRETSGPGDPRSPG